MSRHAAPLASTACATEPAPLTALIVATGGQLTTAADRELQADCAAAAIHVLGASACDNLVRDAVRLAPSVVLCREVPRHPGFIEQCELLSRVAPTPVVAFTPDPDPQRMAQAVGAGIHAYVVQGYAAARLRPLVLLARARCAREQQTRGRLDDLTLRYEERKLVDRAKAVLMEARGLGEEDAFRVLRSTSMHTNQRIGQVAGHVVAAARSADAVNLAGRLRMLSQRFVKQRVLELAARASHGPGSADSRRQVEANLERLGKTVPRASFGALLDAVSAAWAELRSALPLAADAAALSAADAIAARLLDHAGRLTDALESAGLVTRLRVVNVSGRQRMLAQRVAKASLLRASGCPDGDAIANEQRVAASEFEAGLAYLRASPLGGRETVAALAEADRAWQRLLDACGRADTADGRTALDDASDVLLAMFDKLTADYQHSMNVLMG
ncbi:MAG: type IV pili methyl-accepting chemotaxis transducer N-terminal domain-containing protein [Proteobacteria bacterium]|nr:type IV pili methyl-accepting chemotaxis transducer N-terminal domain-containing protein [Pseudomonadota bacterium]